MKAGILFFLITPLFSLSQLATDIYLFDIKIKGKEIFLSNPKNITEKRGYDNQPSFHPLLPVVYYASADDSGRTDIIYYNYVTEETGKVTSTMEREYSPTVTPDGKHISCIIQRDNGQQDLGWYSIKGGKAEILINHLKVGYHAWADKNRLLLFVLEDTTNSLYDYQLHPKKEKIIAQKIGRSLHKIPRQKALSFIDKTADTAFAIKKFDLKTGKISTITHSSGKGEDLTWTATGNILMSDGEKLFLFDTKAKGKWKLVNIRGNTSGIRNISRLAINGTNTKLAMVVSE